MSCSDDYLTPKITEDQNKTTTMTVPIKNSKVKVMPTMPEVNDNAFTSLTMITTKLSVKNGTKIVKTATSEVKKDMENISMQMRDNNRQIASWIEKFAVGVANTLSVVEKEWNAKLWRLKDNN